MDIIEKYSSSLSGEIAEAKIYDREKIKSLIKTYFKMCHKDLLESAMSDYDRQFIELITEQSKNKIGTPKYNEIAFKIGAMKPLKAAANRLLNNLKREDRCSELEVKLAELSKDKDLFRALLKRHAPEAYQSTISSLIIGEEILI